MNERTDTWFPISPGRTGSAHTPCRPKAPLEPELLSEGLRVGRVITSYVRFFVVSQTKVTDCAKVAVQKLE